VVRPNYPRSPRAFHTGRAGVMLNLTIHTQNVNPFGHTPPKRSTVVVSSPVREPMLPAEEFFVPATATRPGSARPPANPFRTLGDNVRLRSGLQNIPQNAAFGKGPRAARGP